MWCCKTTKDQCIIEGEGGDAVNKVICNGTALSLSEQCSDANFSGSSCNYYPGDELRYPIDGAEISRSYLDLCQDNRYF